MSSVLLQDEAAAGGGPVGRSQGSAGNWNKAENKDEILL